MGTISYTISLKDNENVKILIIDKIEAWLKERDSEHKEWKVKSDAIGGGSFGTVYKVVSGEKEYAVKAIILASDRFYVDAVEKGQAIRGMVSKALKEVEAMSKLRDNSDYVVRYEDYKDGYITNTDDSFELDGNGFLEAGYLLIKMELLSGISDELLMEIMKNEDKLLDFSLDIAQGISDMHRFSIMHRDIAPKNILCGYDGDKFVYKLADLNVSVLNEIAMTTTGTIEYIAPEVYNNGNKAYYACGADIYSFGLMLYQFANSGRLPFESADVSAYDAALIRLDGRTHVSKPRNVSSDFGMIICKACAYNPEDRYQSINEMRADLEALKKGEPIIPVIPSKSNTIIAGKNTYMPKRNALKDEFNIKEADTPSDYVPVKNKSYTKLIGAVVAVALIGIGAAYLFNNREADEDIATETAASTRNIVTEEQYVVTSGIELVDFETMSYETKGSEIAEITYTLPETTAVETTVAPETTTAPQTTTTEKTTVATTKAPAKATKAPVKTTKAVTTTTAPAKVKADYLFKTPDPEKIMLMSGNFNGMYVAGEARYTATKGGMYGFEVITDHQNSSPIVQADDLGNDREGWYPSSENNGCIALKNQHKYEFTIREEEIYKIDLEDLTYSYKVNMYIPNDSYEIDGSFTANVFHDAQKQVYYFTPKTTDTYCFEIECTDGVKVEFDLREKHADYAKKNVDVKNYKKTDIKLEAGKTYEITVYSRNKTQGRYTVMIS